MPLRFKKAVDDERIPFGSGPARAAGRFATDHSATGIDRREDAIGQEDFAAIRNPAWIDCTVSHAQTHTGGALCRRVYESEPRPPLAQYTVTLANNDCPRWGGGVRLTAKTGEAKTETSPIAAMNRFIPAIAAGLAPSN